MKKDNELERTLKELKENNREVRILHPSGTYIGKIEIIGRKSILLKPYVVWESFSTIDYGDIARVRLEENTGVPLSKDNLVPTALSEGYTIEMIKSTNHFNANRIKNPQLKYQLFENCILPTEEEINKNDSNYFHSESKISVKNKIGFDYSQNNSK